jgi:hypothetical protein
MDNTVQLFDIIEAALVQTGPADVYISTFSTSEEFLRRIYNLKKRGLIKSASILVDLKASRKTVNLYSFMKNVFDGVFLSENHSKLILIWNEEHNVCIVTSQNQTRGNRTEAGIITTEINIFFQLKERFDSIISTKSLKLDAVFKGTNRESSGAGGSTDSDK